MYNFYLISQQILFLTFFQNMFLLFFSFFKIILFTLMNNQTGLCQQTIRCESEDEEQKSNPKDVISIKCLSTKFIPYVQQLNSSIRNFNLRAKIFSKTTPQSQSSLDGEGSSKIYDSFDLRASRQNKKSKRNHSSRNNSYNKQKNEVKVSGKAVVEFNNGSIFTGVLEYGEMVSGTLQFPDGASYEGQFLNSFFHGNGIFKLPNGTMFKSKYKQGKMQKKGQIIYSNGDRYIGEIYRCRKDGHGELTFANGNKYVGDFKDGELTGRGIYYVNQFPVAKGKWINGQFKGKDFSTDFFVQDSSKISKIS